MKHLFISAELSTLSDAQNKARTRSLSDILAGLSESGFQVSEVQGCYMGSLETSYRVTCPDNDLFNLSMIRTIARQFGQHSILWVNADGQSFLDYLDGNMEHLGTMKKLEKQCGQGIVPSSYSKIGDDLYTVSK
jgi:hypothetical protein